MYINNPVTFELIFFNSFILPFSLDEVYNHVSWIHKNKVSDTLYYEQYSILLLKYRLLFPSSEGLGWGTKKAGSLFCFKKHRHERAIKLDYESSGKAR